MKVSIITVTKNAISTIQDCFDSIESQTYDNIEHIVIDGKSTDGTLELIKSNNRISKYISENDENLYDAMNKGIALCTGQLIGILNSDDVFDNSHVIEDVVNSIGNNDALYSDLCYVKNNNLNKVVRYWKSGAYTNESFKKGWMAPHPTLFVRKEIYNKYGCFNINLSNSADYELILRLFYKFKINVKYLAKTTVRMRVGGVSNKSIANRLKANKEDQLSWELNDLDKPLLFSFFKPLRKLPQYFLKPDYNNE